MTITKGYTFGSTEQVTNTKLHSLVDSATISNLTNSSIASGADIDEAKINFDGSKVVTISDNQTILGDKTFAGLNKVNTIYGSLASFSDIMIGTNIFTNDWDNYASLSSIVGWSSLTAREIYTKKVGKIVFVNYYLSGTSDSVAATFTVPYPSSNTATAFENKVSHAFDNTSTSKSSLALSNLPKNSSVVYLYPDDLGGNWTASNDKNISGQFFYEAA